MRRAYKNLLRLYPYDYRALFAAEMLTAFEESAAERRGFGWAVAELTSVVAGAVTEWIAKFTTSDSIRGRCMPDWRMMRPTGVTQEAWSAGKPAPD